MDSLATFRAFAKIPAELRVMMYQENIARGLQERERYDVKVGLSADGQTLDCPGLELLEVAKEYQATSENPMATVYVQEIEHILFQNPQTRYVFVDTVWPPGHIVDKLSERFSRDAVQHAITRVSFPCFTMHALDLGAPFNGRTLIGRLNVPAHHEQSPYVRSAISSAAASIGRPESWVSANGDRPLRSRIRGSLVRTFIGLESVFPSLKFLELGLDVIDCLWNPIPVELDEAIRLNTLRGWGQSSGRLPHHSWDMVQILERIQCHPNVNQLEVSVRWGDFFRRNRDFGPYTPSLVDIQRLESSFITVLRGRLPNAKIVEQQGRSQ